MITNMKLNYRYKLRPTKEQNATMIEWLNLCRRQYNYRLAQRFQWWEATRTPINSCPLNVAVVPVDRIYQDIPEFRVQVRDGRKLGDDGSFVEIPRFLRKASDRLARLQRAKSNLPKGHQDKTKLHKAIAKLHQKIARQRKDFHFATAYWLFSKADVVFFEELKLKNLIRRKMNVW